MRYPEGSCGMWQCFCGHFLPQLVEIEKQHRNSHVLLSTSTRNYLLWYRIYSSSFWVISIKNRCGNYVWSASSLHFFCSHWFQQTFSAWKIMLFPPSMCRLSAKSRLGILYGVGVESVACSLVRWKRALYFQIVCGAFETQVGHILLVRTMDWNIGAWNRLGKLCSCLVLHLNIMVWTIWCNGEATTLFLQ